MDDLITTREAAAALGLSEQEIRRLVGAARLGARRFSRNLILVPRAEVERYRAERRPRGRPRNAAPGDPRPAIAGRGTPPAGPAD